MDRLASVDDLHLDESMCIRLACLNNVDVSFDSDLKTLQSSTKKLDRYTRINPDLVATLIASLRTRLVELQGQWNELSVSDGGRIANAISEHRSIVSSSSEIQRSANDVGAAMQRLGGDFTERIDALVELDVAYTRVSETRVLFDTLVEILLDIRHIYRSIKIGELYRAAKVYHSTRNAYIRFLQGDKFEGQFEASEAEQVKHRAETIHGSHRNSSQEYSSLISKFLLAKFDDIGKQLEQKVSSMLTEWLTHTSSMSGHLGSEAFKICRMENERNILEWEAKRNCANHLATLSDLNDVVAFTSSIAANVRQKNNVIRKLRYEQMTALSSNLDILGKAVSVDQMFHNSSNLLEKYIQAREGQLGALLIPPENEDHQKYLYRLVGFFLVEICVYNNIPQLGTREYLQTIWEGASSAIVAEVGAMLDEASNTHVMLDLKISSLHACQSLEYYEIEIINTDAFREAMKARIERFTTLLYEPTMVSLEAGEGDGEMLTISVKSCLKSISKYLEGLIPNNNLHHIAILEAEKLYAKIFSRVLSAITGQGTFHDGIFEDLLSFVESIMVIQDTLIESVHQYNSINDTPDPLNRLLGDASSECCTLVAQKIVVEAIKAMSSDPLNILNESESGLISPWSDCIIEQFDFYSHQVNGYGLSNELKAMILTSLADRIALEVRTHFEKYTGNITSFGAYSLYRDLNAIKATFDSLRICLGQNVLVDMVSVSKAIASGDASGLQKITMDPSKKQISKFTIAMLESIYNSTKVHTKCLPLDKETARKLVHILSDSFHT